MIPTNNKKNRKGFTIVELVIVIAVIAILATVLVPTFSDIIEKAQLSAALQEAKSKHTNYVASINYANNETAKENFYIVIDGKYYVEIENGSVKEATTEEPDACYNKLNEDGKTFTAVTPTGVTCPKTATSECPVHGKG